VSASRLPQLGSVIWAELADANGIRKVRPAVVVTATEEIMPGGVVRVAAITTRLPQPLPADYVLLPWNRQGTARSGLRRKSAAVASWLAELPVDDVREVVGILPPTALNELVGKMVLSSESSPSSSLEPDQPSPDDSSTESR
jgi:mRNA-degrading endonuclease toxin of MazEF toxin-antitoxin module